jgi:thiol-disulfide isomerase/thioredoxin
MSVRRIGSLVVAALWVAACGSADGGGPSPADDAVAAEVPEEVGEDASVEPEVEAEVPACLPTCDGTGCGDDHCGGMCACPEPAICIEATLTCCAPACDGVQCGDDGCGGSCGSCGEGATCAAGACCTPSCEGLACGDDGCGGSCGTCDEGLECRNGACREPCTLTDGYVAVAKTISAAWKPKGDVDPDKGILTYQESNSTKYPMSMLRFEIRQYAPFTGPTVPGSYALEDKDYKTCSLCATLFEDCDASGCKRMYLATEGTVEITSLDGANQAFEARLKDVVFKQATIYTNWVTQWTAGGAQWCMSEHPVKSKNVTLQVPQPECVAAGTGTAYDTNIRDFTLTNCLGETFHLHSLCGKKKAIWLLLVTEWCPACAQEMPAAQATQDFYPDKLRLLTIIGENNSGGTPTQATCNAIANLHGLDKEYTFYDPGWQATWDAIYPFGFIGIPYSMALDGDNMAYYWSSGAKGSIGTALTDLMNDEY